MPRNMQKSSSTTCRSHIGQKGSHGDALLWPKNVGKSGKLEVMMENCWKIVEKLKKRKHNGNCCKLEKKERPTNSHSIQSRYPTKPGRPTEQDSRNDHMCAVSVRTSEKKTRIVNIHQQLTCGEQRCTTVIVDGNTRATVATEQGDRKGSSKSLAALTAQKGASSCPATLTSGGGGTRRASGEDAHMIADEDQLGPTHMGLTDDRRQSDSSSRIPN